MTEKEKALEHYLPLIASIARNYLRPGLDIEDMIQEGFLGLLEARERFVPTKGTKFSTYATWWVRKYVLLYIDSEIKATKSMPLYITELGSQKDVLPYLLKLAPEDLELIVMRFGFGEQEALTYTEIGNMFEKSREWARLRIKTILKELRKEMTHEHTE
jgi:RNA polymerase sigma factor (sigma-70 family)